MQNRWTWLIATAALLALPAGVASAAPEAKMAPAVAAAAPRLEPDAIAALDRMGAYLRTLKRFEVKSDSTQEEVLGNGQKLQFLNRVRYVVDAPGNLFAELRNDRRFVRLFFDGKELTVETPLKGYYAQAPMTGTIAQLLTRAYDQFGIDFPLQDLFRWGDPSASAERPVEGFRVGPAKLGDNSTMHYAFRQQGTDFQIWIDEGDKPLPRKLVITTLTDPAQPQYVAYFTWNMDPKIGTNGFSFLPTKDSIKIPLVSANAAAK